MINTTFFQLTSHKVWIFLFVIVSLLCSCQSESSDRESVFELDGSIKIFNGVGNSIKDPSAKKFFLEAMELIKQENYEEANTLLLEADQIEINNVVIINALASNASNLRNLDESYGYYEKALEIDSTFSNTYLSYAVLLNSKGKYDEAINLLKRGYRFIKGKKTRAIFYFNISVSYFYSGQCELSHAHADSVLMFEKNETLIERARKHKNYLNENCPK